MASSIQDGMLILSPFQGSGFQTWCSECQKTSLTKNCQNHTSNPQPFPKRKNLPHYQSGWVVCDLTSKQAQKRSTRCFRWMVVLSIRTALWDLHWWANWGVTFRRLRLGRFAGDVGWGYTWRCLLVLIGACCAWRVNFMCSADIFGTILSAYVFIYSCS